MLARSPNVVTVVLPSLACLDNGPVEFERDGVAALLNQAIVVLEVRLKTLGVEVPEGEQVAVAVP
jgi:hypothetical protein